MSFEIDEKKLQERAQRRLDELQIQPKKIIQRFDQDGDGKLNESERQAALLTFRQEILAEKSRLESAGSEEFDLEEILKERYQVLSKVGSGTQSNVYIARDLSTEDLVVLKQMRVSRLNTWEAYDAFQREARILADIDHPRIPSIIDSFSCDRKGKISFVLVQSYLLGENLEQLVKKGRLFVEEELISIARQCLDLLIVLHGSSPVVLHRDIKPSNLLLDESGVLSLIDFGVVQYARDAKTLAMGTTGYMAPEQLMGRAVRQSDLFSLGVCLIRLATRKKPEDFQLRVSRLHWRDSASLSEQFSNWIDRIIDPESEDRFENAQEAREFLDKLEEVVVNFERGKKESKKGSLVEAKTKLKNPNFRVWTSPELFICTVGPQINTNFITRLEIAGNYAFSGSHRASFEKYGSGFSLTSDSVLEVRCGGWHVGKSKVIKLEKSSFPDGTQTLFNDVKEPVIGSLTEKELNVLFAKLDNFCKSNGMLILK